jgi:hypothetical protein
MRKLHANISVYMPLKGLIFALQVGTGTLRFHEMFRPGIEYCKSRGSFFSVSIQNNCVGTSSLKNRNHLTICMGHDWPHLWSSGQGSWLQIRRPGFDSRYYEKKKVVGLERGPLSLVSTTEELLDRKVAAPF